jgi:hypothetical protein
MLYTLLVLALVIIALALLPIAFRVAWLLVVVVGSWVGAVAFLVAIFLIMADHIFGWAPFSIKTVEIAGAAGFVAFMISALLSLAAERLNI